MSVADATPARRWGLGADSTGGLIGKIILLAVFTAIAVWLAIPLVAAQNYILLALVGLTTLALYVIYLQPWHIPIKYLVPGTIFLILFQIIPVVFTFATAFTNFGDGHRGTKDEAVTSIEGGSVQQVPGSAQFVLTIATEGDPTTGALIFLLTDPTTKAVQRGDDKGLTPVPDAQINDRGKVTAPPEGLTLLTAKQVSDRTIDLDAFSVPTANGAIKASGLSRAYEGSPTRAYDATCDCIK